MSDDTRTIIPAIQCDIAFQILKSQAHLHTAVVAISCEFQKATNRLSRWRATANPNVVWRHTK